MTKTFTESEVTIDTLVAHVHDSGLTPHEVQPDGIWMRSPKGLGFHSSIIEDRKFIRFATYLPLSQHATIGQKHELARRLNEKVFLPVFMLDPDADLNVMYAMPFSGGLIAEAFMSIVNRFGSLLEFVVATYGDDLIVFDVPIIEARTTNGGTALGRGELLR